MPTAPQLDYLFTFTATTAMSAVIPNGPSGTRVIVDASSGTVEGPKLSGTVKGPGGDWVTMRADGSMHLDVRVLVTTNDGAEIFVEYKGIGLDGGKHITTAPMFQTGDERYAWLNSTVAVARGSVIDGGVSYDVFAVA
jgi:hypothetical protein